MWLTHVNVSCATTLKCDYLLALFCPRFALLQAENALEAEKLRVANYLNPSTEAKLLRVCDDEMLAKRWAMR